MNETESRQNIPEKSQKLLQTASRISETLAKLDSSDLMLGKGENPNLFSIHKSNEKFIQEPRVTAAANTLGLNDHPYKTNLETQRENTTIYKYSNSGDQKQNIDVAFLVNRIAALESNLSKPTKTDDSVLKLEALRRQNHEIQNKSSKQELEIKALLDQNDILRKEHRRMQEVESSLRLRLVESSHPSNVKLDVEDQVNQERILQRLDELLGQMPSIEGQLHDDHSNSKHIISYKNIFGSCKKIVKNVCDTQPSNILNLCKSVTEVLSMSLEHILEIIKESQGLDAKIERLRSQSLLVNKDATETIKRMSQEVEALQSSKIQLEQQLSGLKEKYHQLKGQYQEVDLENREFAMKPEPRPEVLVLPAASSAGVESQLESLQKRNREMCVHIDNLNNVILGWKTENESLQKEVGEFKKEKNVINKERLDYIKTIGELEIQVHDEKLKSQKTAEIVKSLQKSLEESKLNENDEKTSDSIGRIFEQQLEAIKSQLSKSSSSGEQSDARIMQVLREIDSKSKKVNDLQNLVKEQESALDKSAREIEKIKEKLSSSKDKFQVKELAWMEKIRKTKTEIETAQKELQETNKYLHGYHDQWLGINALFKESPGKEFHPFDFGVLFNKLYTRTNEVADKCGQLERQLNETRQAFNTTSKELMIQVKQYETLGSESKSTKTSLLDLSSEKAKLECRVNDLESKLSAALQAKKEANDRLKTVTCRMIEYVQDDLFEF